MNDNVVYYLKEIERLFNLVKSGYATREQEKQMHRLSEWCKSENIK